MRNLIIILGLIGIFTLTLLAQPESGKIIGYFTSWSVYGRDYHVTDIPAEKVTHINYAFADIVGGEIALLDSYADIDKFYDGDSWDTDSLRGSFHQLIILKNSYPHIKTLISVGGWTRSTYFSDVAMTTESREVFARSCIEFIRQYQFDGIDLDWEYPVEGGMGGTHHHPDDKVHYTLLCEEIRRQLDSLTLDTGEEYLLTIATPAARSKLVNFQLPELAEVLDFINIMAYDYHGPWGGEGDALTNFNAPFDICDDNPLGEPFHSQFNIIATIDTYLTAGVPPEKINLGLAYYGRGYGNVVASTDGVYQSYSGASAVGTWESGNFDFDDLYHNYIDLDGYTRYWSNDAKVPWLYNPSTQVFISYDDTMSIGIKTRYAQDINLGGVMMWEFSGDEDEILTDKICDVLDSSTAIKESPAIYKQFICHISPNPFNSAITIDAPHDSKIIINDTKGRTIFNQINNIGKIIWNPSNKVTSGIYLISIEKNNMISHQKAVFIK